jgi:hypothetical protein
MAGKRTKVGKTGVPIHGSALKVSRLCRRTAAIKAERNRVNYLASEMNQGFTSASILIKRKTDR